MKERVRGANPRYRKLYGDRGIGMCERWNSFENFLADMGERPHGTSLDRIDNDGNYEPGNCRWATDEEQQGNRRDATAITAFGRTQSLTAWSLETGIRKDTLWRRLHVMGWAPDKAISTPVRRRGGRDLRGLELVPKKTLSLEEELRALREAMAETLGPDIRALVEHKAKRSR